MLCLSHTQDANPVGIPVCLGEIKPVFATVASRASPARSSLDGVILAHRISPARGPKYLRHAEVGCTGPIFVDRQAPGSVAPPFSLPRLDHEGRRRPPEPTTRLPSAADRHVSCPPQGPFSTPCTPRLKRELVNLTICEEDDQRTPIGTLSGRHLEPSVRFTCQFGRPVRLRSSRSLRTKKASVAIRAATCMRIQELASYLNEQTNKDVHSSSSEFGLALSPPPGSGVLRSVEVQRHVRLRAAADRHVSEGNMSGARKRLA